MSSYSKTQITEGYVGQCGPGSWSDGFYVFPNIAPFYNSVKTARREVGDSGKVYKVTVTYEEVTDAPD